jgi:hypothetical protein
MRDSAAGEPLLIADGRMEAVNFPQHPLHNSIWAITAGDDGKIYPGLCCEIEAPLSAVLCQYDPATRASRLIYDLGELTDNPPSGGHMPHSKLHTSLCPAKDGKIYAATHNTAPASGDPIWSMPACYHDRYRHYPGAHIVVYDPVADESRDLGMVVPFDTLYVMRIDRERERLFGVTMMSYRVVIYDIRSGRVRIHDPVGDAVSFGAFHDRWGNWYVCNERGRMIRWLADEDRFVPLHVELPPMRVEGKLWMSYGVTDAEGRLYGITGWDDPHLFRYDPHDGPEGRMDNLGPAWPDRAPDGPRGSRVRGLVFGADGRLYYVVKQFPRQAPREGLRTSIACYDPVSDSHSLMGVAHADGRLAAGMCEGCLGRDGVIYYGEVNRAPTRMLAYHPPYLSPAGAAGVQRVWATSPELAEWEAWQASRGGRPEAEYGQAVERNQHRYLPGARLIEPKRILVPLGPDDPFGEIAWYESAIQVLIAGKDGLIHGGTGGRNAHLFVFDGEQVRPLGAVADSEGEVTGLVSLAGGCLIGSIYAQGSAALFRCAQGRRPERIPAAIPGSGPVRLCADPGAMTVYGIAMGSGDLFRFDPATERLVSLGRAPGEGVSPTIVCDDQGNLFGASDWGRLFRRHRASGRVEQLDLYLPHMAHRRFLAGWSAAARLADGTICGGTAGDGMLFLLDPTALVIRSRGKPARQDHIAGLALGPNGTVWGIAGERDDICHVFSHNPATGESADEGAVGWRVKTIAAMGDALVMGEARAVSRLILLRPAQ